MGTTEAELKREAEMQRERMGTTLESIGDRMSPERMVERRKAAVGQGFKRLRESVMGSSDYEEPMTERMRSQAQGVAQSAAGTAQSAAQRVQHAPEAIANTARGNPLAAGLVAFGVGALLATVFPETRTEQRLVESAAPQIQHATDQLKDAGRELAQDAKQHGQEAMQEVKSTASDATSSVADEAKGAAQHVSNQARNT